MGVLIVLVVDKLLVYRVNKWFHKSCPAHYKKLFNQEKLQQIFGYFFSRTTKLCTQTPHTNVVSLLLCVRTIVSHTRVNFARI